MAKYAELRDTVANIRTDYEYLMTRKSVRREDAHIVARLRRNCLSAAQTLHVKRPIIPVCPVKDDVDAVLTHEALVWAAQIMLVWDDVSAVFETREKSAEEEAIEDEILERA